MYNLELSKFATGKNYGNSVVFWPFDPAKNAIQGDASEGSDTF